MGDKPANLYGWCATILKIDLSDARITELKTKDYADRFLDGHRSEE